MEAFITSEDRAGLVRRIVTREITINSHIIRKWPGPMKEKNLMGQRAVSLAEPLCSRQGPTELSNHISEADKRLG